MSSTAPLILIGGDPACENLFLNHSETTFQVDTASQNLPGLVCQPHANSHSVVEALNRFQPKKVGVVGVVVVLAPVAAEMQ